MTNPNGDVRCPTDGEYVNVQCWACGWVRPGYAFHAAVVARAAARAWQIHCAAAAICMVCGHPESKHAVAGECTLCEWCGDPEPVD